MFRILFLFLVVSFSCSKNNDPRVQKVVKLENGLNVLLISDSRTQKATASLNVAVGSYFNTTEGITHFLEHMLFLGTEKYPQAGDFNKFINTNQGSFNGYTSTENTNYYFDIDDNAYDEALDRFAQFFIKPLLDGAYIEKEKNAVDSEFRLRKEDDRWREKIVENETSNPKHPASRFTIGNLETLKNIDREELLSFFQKYYVAENMDLVLISKFNIEKMEELTKRYFSQINKGEKNDNFTKLPLFVDLPTLVKIQPKTDKNVLKLIFELPSADKYWRSKPDYFLASLIGHEGEGSLLSLLKKQNLALELSAGVSNISRNNSIFEVLIKLSNDGVKDYEKVIEYFFAYINMLKKDGLKKYYYEDIKSIAEINYKYKNHIEAIEEAPWLAKNMFLFNPLDIDKNLTLFFDYSKDDFKLFLSAISPLKAKIVFVNKDIKTNTVEKYMKVNYSVQKLDPEFVKSIESVSNDKLYYPSRNKYIPDSLKILSSKNKNPYVVVQNKECTFWLFNDEELKLPKVKLSLTIHLDKKFNENIVLKKLFVKSVNESLREWSYPISEAGSSFLFTDVSEGLELSVLAYSDKIDVLTKDIFEKIKSFNLSEEVFESLKDELYLSYKNFEKKYPYEQALYSLSVILKKYDKHYLEFLNDIKPVKFNEVKEFSNEIFKNIFINGLVYGNIEPEDIKDIVKDVFKTLESKTIDKDNIVDKSILKIPSGSHQVFSLASKMDNNAFLKFYEVDTFNPKKSAMWKMISTILNPFFYTELRTNEQFGYVVFSDQYAFEDVLGYMFVVQSPKSSPESIQASFTKWSSRVDNYFSLFPVAQFENARKSIIAELRKKETNIDDKFSLLNTIVNIYDGDFTYKDKIIAELEKMSMADVVAEFSLFVQSVELSSSITIFVYQNGLRVEDKNAKDLMSNINKFKESLELY